METLRIVGYCRVSTQEQVDEGISLSAQRQRITAWAEATGAEVAEVIEDGGVSGTCPLAERPGGRRVAALLDQRRPTANAVVVCRLDRLGRDASETLAYLRRFSAGEIGLISITERIDLSSASGRMLSQMSAVISEYERSVISERTAEAIRSLRSQGRIYGPTPYGYRTEKDHLVACPAEQQVLTTIRRLRSRGLSYAKIAAGLNARSVPAKRGRWHGTGVRSVLKTSATLAEGKVSS